MNAVKKLKNEIQWATTMRGTRIRLSHISAREMKTHLLELFVGHLGKEKEQA